MVTELRRPDLLSTDFPVPVLALLAVATVVLWIAAHWLKGRIADKWQRRGFLAVQALFGVVAVWSVCQFAARFVVLSTPWSLWSLALVTAGAVEVAVGLYELERSLISRLTGRALLGLRIALILLLSVMLAQPILQWEKRTEITRYVAVMLDDSASMHISDRALTPSEKLKLASLFDVRAVRGRPRMDLVPGSLTGTRDKLVRECAAFQMVPESDAAAFESLLKKQGAALAKLLQDAVKALNSDYATLGRAAGVADQELEGVRSSLKKTVIPRLVEATAFVSGRSPGGIRERRQGLLRAVNAAGDELAKIMQILPPAVAKADAVFYSGLNPVDRKAIEDIAGRTRAAIAHDVLTSPGAGQKGILDRLGARYSVKFVRFASEPVTTDVDAWLKTGGKYVPPVSPAAAGPGLEDKTAGADLKDFQESTDIGAALEKTAKEAPADSLAGVLVLTDGRHNGKVSPEAAARQIGAMGAPVCTVVIGSRETPKDAAVLDVVAPVSVYLGDKVNLQVLMRFDALRGRKAKVRLMMGGQPVDEVTVEVPDDKFRANVSLGHTPPAVGIYDYEVEIAPLDDEPLKENNKWRVRVAASDNRINVLLVDGLPRWEFRYLRNLLYARDRAVQLQYVLLEPDGLDGAPPPAVVYASAARKFGDAEATALPKTRDEWMRFDTIILGDVPPAAIDAGTLDDQALCLGAGCAPGCRCRSTLHATLVFESGHA